jgi:hypothetical protein
MKKVASAKCILLFCLVFNFFFSYAQNVFRTTATGTIIGYYEYLPQDYHSNSNKYPVVIFLHGMDERGSNSTDPAVLAAGISPIAKLGPPMHVKNGAQFPFILISPQLKSQFGSWPSDYVREVVDHLRTYLRIDERRIHVTGLSLGGYGAWTCIEELPRLFASGASVCGGNNNPANACNIASENVATWAFHGDADEVVSYTKTTKMVNAINACSPAPNPLAKATIYAGIEHNAWYRAYYLDNKYHNPNVYQWWMTIVKTKKNGNTIPQANAGSDKSVSGSSVSISGSATDAGGSISSYRWFQLQGPSKATLSGSTSATLTASSLVTGKYVFGLQVTDNGGATDTDYVIVNVSSGGGTNVAPVADAGSSKTITLPTSSTSFTGSGSDSDGSIASYSWTKVSGGAASLSGASTATLSVSGLVAGSYTFRLTVTDDDGATDTDDVTLTVNIAPDVSAGADKTITLPANSTSITGSASDPDGSISTYAWTKLSGGTATLSGATTATLNVTGMIQGAYVFRLTATDNRGASKYDDVTVNVVSGTNAIPVANSGADQVITLPSNSIVLAGSGTDSDGTITAYAWSKVSGGNATLSGASTATLTASALVAGTYVFRLRVTDDDGATDGSDVTVIVNNAPTVSVGSDRTINLPANSVSITGTASDSDGSVTSFTWTKVSGGSATLSGASTSTLAVSGLTQGAYTFRLTVRDNHGASKSDDVVVSVVSSSNALPIADAGNDVLISLPTNAVSIVGSGSDSDGSIQSFNWSKISGGSATLTNAATTTLNVSGLVAGTYIFRLQVTDNGGATDTDDVTVVVNNPPSVSVGADFNITLPTNSLNVQGTVSDTDGTIASYQWKMTTGTVATLSGTTTSRLTATGLIAGRYVFRLIVKDNHGAQKFDDVLINVLNNPNNTAPTANAGSDRVISLPSNSLSLSGSASDLQGGTLLYSWAKISGGTATLSNATTAAPTASSLVAGSYVFRLTVTDDQGLSDTDDVTVIVNQPPTVSVGADFKITLPTNSLSVQGTASDADGTISTYLWKMTTGTVGTLTNTTTSRLTASGLAAGRYVFRLYVKDNRGAQSFDDVLVNVLSTSGASVDEIQIVELGNNQEEVEFDWKNDAFWKDKKVALYDGAGRELFKGTWTTEKYYDIIQPGVVYIYNVANENRTVRRGKFVRTNL